jgi:hypothetical protein
MERFYRVAGIGIRLCNADGTLSAEHGTLAPFLEESGDADYTMTIALASEFPEPEGETVFREESKWVFRSDNVERRYIGAVESSWQSAFLYREQRGGQLQALIRENSTAGVILPKLVIHALGLEHLITEQNGFLLHASYILHNGKAILFTAPSGTGKSTQAELWRVLRGAELINGDRAAVRQGPEGLCAWGLPVSGSSRVSKNVTAPLAAIVYLSQAPETSITRLTGVRAFRRVWEGCSLNVWNREAMEKATQAVMDTVTTVPVYHLACTPDETAVKALENAMGMQR